MVNRLLQFVVTFCHRLGHITPPAHVPASGLPDLTETDAVVLGTFHTQDRFNDFDIDHF